MFTQELDKVIDTFDESLKINFELNYLIGNCNGDSGGPLIFQAAGTSKEEFDDTVTVTGIVSWGFIPCGSHLPDVLERVYPHMSWILKEISDNRP